MTSKRRPKPPRPPRRPRYKRPGSEPAAIDESALLDRLQQQALGTADMTSTQVRAAEIVLKKAKAADEPENPAVRYIISDQPLSEEEWARQYPG